jgi:hypothetical protein
MYLQEELKFFSYKINETIEINESYKCSVPYKPNYSAREIFEK